MRVLFITGEYPAMQGGVGDYTRCLGQALGRLGATVLVWTHPDAGGTGARPAEPCEPVVYPTLNATGWRLWGQALRMVRELAPDVVHIQYQTAAFGLHPAVNWLPWYLRRQRGLGPRPAIYTTFHDLRVPYMFPKAGPLRRQAVLALARSGEAAIVTNPADWADLASAGLAQRLCPIPIGSNIYPTPPAGFDRAAQRARWGVAEDDWLLAYFGFLNANKGGETLVRALAELVQAGRPAHLLMIGGQVGASDPTNAAYLAHVRALLEGLGLAERVRWTGFTGPEEVTANLCAADCAVLPYRQGASLRHGSLMAALAHGLPVVTTAGPASAPQLAAAEQVFPRFVDGVSALLVPPDDPGRIAQGVTRVMSDPALRGRLAAGALATAAHFGWDAIARQHMDLYAQHAPRP